MTTDNTETTATIDPDAQCREHGCARWQCDEAHPAPAPLTDEQLLRCDLSTTVLTSRQWARLAVLAADQAGMSADDQAELASQLELLQSTIPDGATDAEAMAELVRTDYDNEPELAFCGKRGEAAAHEILTVWCRNDRGAADLVARLGRPAASKLYLETWGRVHAAEIGGAS